MNLSRRKFLATVATAGSAAIASPTAFAAPYQASVKSGDKARPDLGPQNTASGPNTPGVPFSIPSTMPMGSGAPLGGIGTGFVEVRADGCFYEWQIFNSGPWAQNARSTTAPPAPGPQYLRFVLHARKASGETPQVRRLYLRSDESDVYTLPFVQDVQSIDYSAWFPMTGLRYNDPSLPVRVSAEVFSPFIPGHARESGTPGFHVVYTLENTSRESVEVSLAGFMDNPLASALPERRLTNAISQDDGVTRIFLHTAAESDFPSGIGNMCFSVSGGEHSFIAGTFQEYALPGNCRWETPRVNYMLLSVMQEFLQTGRLPNTKGGADPSIGLPTVTQIDSLSIAELKRKIDELSSDALLARVFADARAANANDDAENDRKLLREVRENLLGINDAKHLTWGTGALASSVNLAPGQKVDVGTKSKVTVMAGRYEDLGRDLVAAVAGDIVVMGATPLTFLDYLGFHKTEPEIVEALVRGMSAACIEAGIALVAARRRRCPRCMRRVTWMWWVCDRCRGSQAYADGSEHRRGRCAVRDQLQRPAYQWVFAGAQADL